MSEVERMSRSEALGILGRMAQKRGTTLDEVRALQVAVRCVVKRLFDTERHYKRKREENKGVGGVEDAFITPPFAVRELADMEEGRTETPRQDSDGWLENAIPKEGKRYALPLRVVCAKDKDGNVLEAVVNDADGKVVCPHWDSEGLAKAWADAVERNGGVW